MKSRQIRADGWLFRFAYYLTTKEKRPKKVNLCQFVRTVMLMALFSFVVACIFAAALTAVGFTLYQLGLGIWWLMTGFRWGSVIENIRAPSPDTQAFLYVMLAWLLLCGYVLYLANAPPYIRRWLMKFELAQLVSDYVRAKKEKICPMYDVVKGEKDE